MDRPESRRGRTTLARRLGYKTTALVAGVALLALAMLWGISGLRRDYQAALWRYNQLRAVFEVGMAVASARDILDLSPQDMPGALRRVESALGQLDVARPQWPAPAAPGSPEAALADAARRVENQLLSVRALLREQGEPDPARAALRQTLGDLSGLAQLIRQDIARLDHDSNERLRAALSILAGASLLMIVGAIAVEGWQYRRVMTPLRELGRGVRDLAAGRLERRLPAGGDEEFARLAEDFNHMAAELDGLYRDLERRVAQKSRELVKSERLASVGFLAAGVAHEINNPLAIMTGHAELALRQLDAGLRKSGESGGGPGDGQGDAGTGRAAADEARRALCVIRDEAFRCKEITRKLLELSRPGGEGRGEVDLEKVAAEVATMVRGLPKYRDRRLTLRFDAQSPARVTANPTEMRQVVLNLTVNALEATAAGGEVTIAGLRRDGRVALSVEDNGRGMGPETLARVFEPFFTDKRGVGEPGTGLGLAITHAIVSEHGGRISAQSDGPWRGSRFVVDLPAAGAGAGPGDARTEHEGSPAREKERR